MNKGGDAWSNVFLHSLVSTIDYNSHKSFASTLISISSSIVGAKIRYIGGKLYARKIG